ncbi:hypothetical protein QU755_21740 [Pseudomonas wenzhouensis]|nr:hypothetical protein [Pseudomonas wenzhouensis]MDM9654000.1 hypothetical protein [Pseudomonas wenzhouensis]
MTQSQYNKAELDNFKRIARETAIAEFKSEYPQFTSTSITITALSDSSVDASDSWSTHPYDFNWHARLKSQLKDSRSIGIALWSDSYLCAQCYATPHDSPEKILVLYLQADPKKDHPLVGHVAALCLTAVRFYGVLLGLKWVVIKDPNPEAIKVYKSQGFSTVPRVGLALSLSQA